MNLVKFVDSSVSKGSEEAKDLLWIMGFHSSFRLVIKPHERKYRTFQDLYRSGNSY
jgi:hypothetical protein